MFCIIIEYIIGCYSIGYPWSASGIDYFTGQFLPLPVIFNHTWISIFNTLNYSLWSHAFLEGNSIVQGIPS